MRMLNSYLRDNQITRAAFARSLGVTPQAVSRWCHGAALPRLGLVQQIKEMTGGEITLEYWAGLARERRAAK